MNKRLYVDINILQSVPSSNINRDDTGAPKTAMYGGVTRARVSSQSWKRATRRAFADDSQNAEWLNGIRTLQAPQLLADEIKKQQVELSDEEAMDKSLEVFKQVKIKLDKKTNHTKALLMVSAGQLKKLAEYILNNSDWDKKELKEIMQSEQSLDISLFGRMVADDPSLNVDASCQVAHAISTHEVVPEFDYYTAVDDKKADDESGAAMLGTIEYNSSMLYRYANVNVDELMHNLGELDVSLKGLRLFIKDFIMSMPTGKQNSFANKTIPQYVMVTIREDTPVNLVSAFEQPVRSRDGYLEPSIKKLEEEYMNTQKFVEPPLANFVVTNGKTKIGQEVMDINSLLDNVLNSLETRINHEDISD